MAVAEQFFIKELANGLTLLGQKMPSVSSAAMSFLTRAGSSHDADGLAGAAAVASEWLMRGAGDRDVRQLNDALDGLGCQHHEHVQSEHMQFASAQLGRNLPEVLAIYADILRRPRMDEATFESCRQLTVQDLLSLEDEPAQKCSLMLRERFYPHPLGRCPYGTAQSLGNLTAQNTRNHVQSFFGPTGAMLAVAGNFDWPQLCELIDKLFGDWPVTAPVTLATTPPARGHMHVTKESAQVHIAMAYPSVTAADKYYYAARVAETILSGGMSGRLFSEVREKRGLVYHVSARYHTLKSAAGIFVYAGTSPDRAQQTLEVTAGELRRLAEGVTQEELARAKVQVKSALVMQGESTSARASSLSSDWYHLGRLRGLEEISVAIEAVTDGDVIEHLRQHPPREFAILTIGPEPLKTDAIE